MNCNVTQGWRLSSEDVARAQELHSAVFHRAREFFKLSGRAAAAAHQTAQPGRRDHGVSGKGRGRPAAELPGVDALGVLRDCDRGDRALGASRLHALGMTSGLAYCCSQRSDRFVLEVGHAFESAAGVGQRRSQRTRSAHAR